MSSYTVSIIGRPNVGKSTLFNRLVGERKAIVDNQSGVTRDRHFGNCFWNGKDFFVIDTGGFVPQAKEYFDKEITKQAFLAIEQSDLILFMVNVETGVTDYDSKILNILRKQNQKFLLVVNKVDNYQRMLEAQNFYSLSKKNIFFISSSTGSGTGELLDEITKGITLSTTDTFKDYLKIAIVGRPNVGKSSLLNALLDEQRTIVTDIAGTTRDSIYIPYNKFNKKLVLIDTAGVRKKYKAKDNLEFYSNVRTLKAIEESDVCLLLVDVNEGVLIQDLAIFKEIIVRGKGVVLIANKWDILDKDEHTVQQLKKQFLHRLEPFSDVSLIFISALEKKNILKVLDEAEEVHKRRKQHISTSTIHDFLVKTVAKHPPPTYRGHPIKINYGTQLKTSAVSFAFFSNFPKYIKEPYKNYLVNALRKRFDFTGVPIRIYFRKK